MKPGSSDGILTVLASILVSAVLFIAQHFTSAPRTNFDSMPEENLAEATTDARADSYRSGSPGNSRTASLGGAPQTNAPQWSNPFDQPFEGGASRGSVSPPNRLPSVPASSGNPSSVPSNTVATNKNGGSTRTFGASTASSESTANRTGGQNTNSAPTGNATNSFKVISIIDGDTVDLLVNRQPLRLRLNGIDTPEKGQPFGNTAKDVLSKAIGGQNVQYVVRDTDRYGRSIADVYFRGVHINKWLVQKGLAWHYKAYNNDIDLAEAEQQAAAARRGLWADPRRVAPWNWRKLSKVERDQYR